MLKPPQLHLVIVMRTTETKEENIYIYTYIIPHNVIMLKIAKAIIEKVVIYKVSPIN